MWMLVSAAIAAALAVACLSAWRKKWTIDDTPSSTCRGVFVGRNEVVGEAVPLYQPIVTPFTQTPAVWFSWKLEEWKRSGDDKKWVTIEKRQTAAPFWIIDATGRVLVRPRSARIDAVEGCCDVVGGGFDPPYSRWQLRQWVLVGEDVVERALSMADPDFSVPPTMDSGWFDHTADTATPLGGLPGRHRVTEQFIGADAPIYLLGTARPRSVGPGLEFAGSDLFVSTKSEAQVASSTGWSARLSGLGCLIASAITVGGVTQQATGEVKWAPIVWTVAIEVGALFLITLVRNYNRQVQVKEQAANAWSLIDVSLQRRAELIPNLVEVVKGYSQYEQRVQVALAELRAVPPPPPTETLPSDPNLAQAQTTDQSLKAASRTLVALAEAYPALKADRSYIDLQLEIADAEESVASARTFYNAAIEMLRTRRQQFPGSLFARLVRVPSWELFEAEEAARYVPAVAVAPEAAEMPPPTGPPAAGLPPPLGAD